MHHLVQGGCDKTRQADDIHLLFFRLLQNLAGRYHYAKVNHLEVITLQHHADNVLADVMHITLHRCH